MIRPIFIAITALVLFMMLVEAAFSAQVETIVLNKKNHVVLSGTVSDESVDKVLLALTQSDPKERFYIYLDSPGGSVLAGRRLVSFLTDTDRPITCIAGTAISMAYVTLQACPIRSVTAHSILMTHQIASSNQGTLKELKSSLQFVQKLADLYDGLIAKRMGLSLEKYRTLIDPEFWIVGAQDALNNRAADNEVKVVCTKELEKANRNDGDAKNVNLKSICPVS